MRYRLASGNTIMATIGVVDRTIQVIIIPNGKQKGGAWFEVLDFG